jgi:Domain of unknown function (DUF4349)
MEPNRDDQLIADLQALRPTPRPQFAAELDERAAAGFPRRSRKSVPAFFTAMRIKRPAHPLRLLIPAGGVAVIAIAIVTALSIGGSGSSSESQPGPSSGLLSQAETFDDHPAPEAGDAALGAEANSAAAEEASGTAFEAEAPAVEGAGSAATGVEARPFSHRAVERSAEITLAADPKDVDDDAARVFEAVHANNGIVMRSSTEEGRAGEAGATFDLLIPSARLDDAMAAFSDIDAVRSRHEATADITAPTVTAAELLKESRARIDSLLNQLEGAETEEEQEAVEAELRHERRHAGRLAAQLSHLHKRADFSRVSLRIETGGDTESSDSSAWGIDDAFHDAGHVLTVVVAVTLIALAILGPLALIALLAWLTHRTWVRRERRRVLS